MPAPKLSDEVLREAVDAVAQHGNPAEAAKALGIADSTLRHRLMVAARDGHAPGFWTHGTPEGYSLGKVTLQVDGMGNVQRAWPRMSPDTEASTFEDRLARLTERAERLPIFPERPPVAPTGSKLANMFMYCDFHLGMHAWHKEGGADWDLKIAARTFKHSLDTMIFRAPQADTAILAINGDFYHANGAEPLTPKSKHVLDVDGRYEKVREIGLDLICDAIDLLLATHAVVKVLPIEGNHDPDAMADMRITLRRVYKHNPRVWINDSPLPYVAVQHGKNMLCWHHGHLKNNAGLVEVFCSGTFRPIWGVTEFTYIHTGHRHHLDKTKGGVANVTQHSTIAARDAYAARGGYVSQRSISVTTYHEDFGIWNEAHLSSQMLEAA